MITLLLSRVTFAHVQIVELFAVAVLCTLNTSAVPPAVVEQTAEQTKCLLYTSAGPRDTLPSHKISSLHLS